MFIKKKYSGFTLIELLIVVAVITTLSTLTVIYLDNSRMTARDARRIADVKQVQLALKMFYNDLGYYPTAITPGEPIVNGNITYLSKVPSNPSPRADSGCPDQDYHYTQVENGARYSFTFCLGEKTDDLDAGVRVATHNGILNCPENWLAIPGNRELHTNDFCVMKYEAKCASPDEPNIGLKGYDDGYNTYDASIGEVPCNGQDNNGLIVSLPSGYPVAYITFDLAQSFCHKMGARLMTNAEWTTIARNSENIASDDMNTSNWTEGSINQGSMPLGIGSGSKSDEANDEFFQIGEHLMTRRTLSLSTGQKIWDFSGSVSEWVDNECVKGSGIGKYENSGGIIQWNQTSDPDLSDYERPMSGPSENISVYDSIGAYQGCSEDNNKFIRGGNANVSGIYDLDLSWASNHIDPLLGFRCVKN